MYLLHCTWRCNILCSKLKRKKQVLALVLIEDLGFLPFVREIQRLSTRSATLHSWKDGISHTHGRNPRSSLGTRVRTYYSRMVWDLDWLGGDWVGSIVLGWMEVWVGLTVLSGLEVRLIGLKWIGWKMLRLGIFNTKYVHQNKILPVLKPLYSLYNI